MRKFFDNYEYFSDYEYPFGLDFLKGIFGDNYTRKYSLSGEGIFNLIFVNDKIYSVDFKKGTSLLTNDGKKALRDTDKDFVVEKICDKLKENNIEYTTNSGKFITFKYNNIIFKLEIVKKAAMPA